MDTTLFAAINGSHAPGLDEAMLFASAVGRAGFVWLFVAVVAAIYPRHRMAAWRVGVAIGLTYLMVDGVIKPLADRARPFDVLPEVRLIDQRPATSSFPSGHAASAVAGALAVSQIFPAARIVWWPLAALIAISRIYVGVHWPSDTLAGALVGFATGSFVLGGRLGAHAALASRAGAESRSRRVV